MNLKEYLKTWEGTQAENKWNRVVNGVLVIAVFILSLFAFKKETIITVQPYTLTHDAWVSESSASEGYIEAWGLFLASMVGNATPDNLEFLKERIKPLLGPEIYQDVINTMEIQSRELIEDRITIRFEPRHVEYEKTTNKVFVYGNSYMEGANQAEIKTERTYEFELSIGNYAPLLNYMNTYAGRPQTEEVVAQMRAKEQRESRKS